MSLVTETGIVNFKQLNGHYKRFAMTRVKAGLQWIKENAANEKLDLSKIDLDTLDQMNGDLCVLAQLMDDIYEVATARFAMTPNWIVEHGFDGCQCYQDEDGTYSCGASVRAPNHVRLYVALTDAWRTLLQAERTEVTVAS